MRSDKLFFLMKNIEISSVVQIFLYILKYNILLYLIIIMFKFKFYYLKLPLQYFNEIRTYSLRPLSKLISSLQHWVLQLFIVQIY